MTVTQHFMAEWERHGKYTLTEREVFCLSYMIHHSQTLRPVSLAEAREYTARAGL